MRHWLVLLAADRKGAARLRREFIAIRNKLFGRPDHQLKRELDRRLIALRCQTAAN
jgi:hypothetical protein